MVSNTSWAGRDSREVPCHPAAMPTPPSNRRSRGPAMTDADPYGWITEPTAELVDLLDAERAYYEARVAPLAGLRAELAAEMAARVPDRPSRRRGGPGPSRTAKSTRRAPSSPRWCAAPPTARTSR